jgi:ABC-type transporter Mla MlaB component
MPLKDEIQGELETDAVLCAWEERSTGTSNDTNLKSCTIKDVARMASVSVATVSRVVNGTTLVSAKTTHRVLSAISRLQYRPNAHAAQLGKENRGVPRRREFDMAGFARQGSKTGF